MEILEYYHKKLNHYILSVYYQKNRSKIMLNFL